MTEKKDLVPKEILVFLQSLLMEKGLDDLPGNIQGDIIYDLYLRYNDFLIASFLQNMDEATRNEFNDLVAKEPKEKELEEFLKSKTDYQKIVEDTTNEFRNIYLGNEQK